MKGISEIFEEIMTAVAFAEEGLSVSRQEAAKHNLLLVRVEAREIS
jgi:hypothetical protein